MKAAQEALAKAIHDNMENQSHNNFKLKNARNEVQELTKIAEGLLEEAAELKDALSALNSVKEFGYKKEENPNDA
jgi:flagellin-like hook-associated protein FlgL